MTISQTVERLRGLLLQREVFDEHYSDADNQQITTDIRSLIQSLSLLQEENEALRAGLEPFAKALADGGDDESQPDDRDIWEHPIAMLITLGDLRRARAVSLIEERSHG